MINSLSWERKPIPKLWISISSSRRNRWLLRKLTPRSKEKYRRQRNKSLKTLKSSNIEYYQWKVEVQMMPCKLSSNALLLWVLLWSSSWRSSTSNWKSSELQRRSQCLMFSARYFRNFTGANLKEILPGHTLILVLWPSFWKTYSHYKKDIVPTQ